MYKAVYLFSAIFSFSMIAILYTIHNIGVSSNYTFAASDKSSLFMMIFALTTVLCLYKFFTIKDI